MSWRLAKALEKLRDQYNTEHPNRNKASDGGIGDEAHQAEGSASDHNPWIKDVNGVGVVTAFDFTHDPANGMDIDKLTDVLLESHDSRIKYIIANGLILIPNKLPWASNYGWYWQEYAGDPHTNHMHISINTTDYDNETDWNIGEGEEMSKPTYDQVLSQFRTFGAGDPTEKQMNFYVEHDWGTLNGHLLQFVSDRRKEAEDQVQQLKSSNGTKATDNSSADKLKKIKDYVNSLV